MSVPPYLQKRTGVHLKWPKQRQCECTLKCHANILSVWWHCSTKWRLLFIMNILHFTVTIKQPDRCEKLRGSDKYLIIKSTISSGPGWGSKVTELFQLSPWWSTSQHSRGGYLSCKWVSVNPTPLHTHTQLYSVLPCSMGFCNVTSGKVVSALIQIFGAKHWSESVTLGRIAPWLCTPQQQTKMNSDNLNQDI